MPIFPQIITPNRWNVPYTFWTCHGKPLFEWIDQRSPNTNFCRQDNGPYFSRSMLPKIFTWYYFFLCTPFLPLENPYSRSLCSFVWLTLINWLCTWNFFFRATFQYIDYPSYWLINLKVISCHKLLIDASGESRFIYFWINLWHSSKIKRIIKLRIYSNQLLMKLWWYR